MPRILSASLECNAYQKKSCRTFFFSSKTLQMMHRYQCESPLHDNELFEKYEKFKNQLNEFIQSADSNNLNFEIIAHFRVKEKYEDKWCVTHGDGAQINTACQAEHFLQNIEPSQEVINAPANTI